MAQIVYSTIGSLREARTIADALVRERLAACVNLIPKVESVYRWKGTIENAQECVLLAKTRDEKAQAVIDRIRSLHSYELPDIIVLPITGGLPEFLNYITEEST